MKSIMPLACHLLFQYSHSLHIWCISREKQCYILLAGTSKNIPSAVTQSFPFSSTTLAFSHVLRPSFLSNIASTMIIPGVLTGARYRTFIKIVIAVMSAVLLSDAYSLFTVNNVPISSSNRAASKPPCAIAGKPLRSVPSNMSVRTAGMGTDECDCFEAGSGTKGAWHSVKYCEIVEGVCSATAKKESSVEALNCRHPVGTAVQPGSEMSESHHGTAWKNALVLERASALLGSIIVYMTAQFEQYLVVEFSSCD